MWEPDTLRAGPAGPGRSEDGMSGKKKSGSAKAVPRAYGRLTRHERDTVQRMLERRASCREIARELGRSPSTVSAEVASHRVVTAPKSRRGERVDGSLSASDFVALLSGDRSGLKARLVSAPLKLAFDGSVDIGLARQAADLDAGASGHRFSIRGQGSQSIAAVRSGMA